MRRRDFITLLGAGATAFPLMARAQQGNRVRRIGVMIQRPDDDPLNRDVIEVFEQSLGNLGWAVGRNLAIDYRWGVNDFEKGRSAVEQILRVGPDAIVANGSPALIAARQATAKVPIVFTGVSEPVERGFVLSVSRPGGNITGITNLEATMGGKWLELLTNMVPRARRIIAVFNPASSFAVRFVHSAEAAASTVSVEVAAVHVTTLAEIEAAISALAHEPPAALMFPSDGFTTAYRELIANLTARYGLPAIGPTRFAAAGLLMSYAPDEVDQFRRAAGYVDRVLRGERPADLPVESPVKFEFVINAKVAKALGLAIPPNLFALAHELIE